MNDIREFPALGAQLPNSIDLYFPTTQLPIYLRPLTKDENILVKRFGPEITKGINHFRLFRIFTSNYKSLINVISGGLRAGVMDDDERLEFDCALLNLLASGKAVTDHFDKFFTSKYRKSDKRDELKKYYGRLRSNSWAFAFMEDVRDYVQHQGLPIILYNRRFSGTSVELKFKIDVEKLSKDRRAWKRSKLDISHGELDFFKILLEYYLRMTRDLGAFLAKWLMPDYIEAHNFFAQLTTEVRTAVPGSRMIVLTKFNSEAGKHSFSFLLTPEDVFGEMGITVQQ